MRELTIALTNNRYSAALRDGTVKSPEVSLKLIEFEDVVEAFDAMVMDQAFDVCEMALGTALQAHEIKKPITLLPTVRSGGIHHDRLRYWPANGDLEPGDLKGKRLGVRAYTQTTGLWVRGILWEEQGIGYGDLEWMTTEGPHVKDYEDPPFVIRADDRKLSDLLRDGEVVAIAGGLLEGSASVYKDVPAAQRAWYDRHHTNGINHMVTVKTELVEEHPGLVNEVYRMLEESHNLATASDPAPDPNAIPSPIVYGISNVRAGVELGIEYAVEQRLIPTAPTIEDLFPSFLLDT